MKEIVDLFKLFSSETNLRLMSIFIRTSREVCVCELSDVLGLPVYEISRSLSKLKRYGFINSEKRKKFSYYKKSETLSEPLKKKFLSLVKNIPEVYYEKDLLLLNKRISMRNSKNNACIISKEQWKREVNFILKKK